MEMTSAFTDVLHVANLTTGSHLMSILTQSDAFSKVCYDDDDDDISKFNTGGHLMSILTQSNAFSKDFYDDGNDDDNEIQR